MVSLYNNHQNKNLMFKMDIVGVDSSQISPRLIIEGKKSIQLIKGIIEDNVCKFDVPILTDMDQGNKGKIYYEAIVGEDQYSKLWEENFEVISNTEIKIVESNFQQEEIKKPSISLSAVSQVEDVKEEIVEEKENIEIKEETEEVKEEKENKDEIYIEDESENITEDKKENEETPLVSYEVFLKNKNNSK